MEQQLQTAVFAANRLEQPSARTWLQFPGYSIRRQPLGAAGGEDCCLILAAVWAGQLAPSPQGGDFTALPCLTRNFLLGTDHLGRDIFSRLLWGARLSSMSGWCR